MDETISAAEANRKFSQLLRGVRAGRRYIVTSHGTPVALILPAPSNGQAATGGRAALMERLGRQSVSVPQWTRRELYEDEE